MFRQVWTRMEVTKPLGEMSVFAVSHWKHAAKLHSSRPAHAALPPRSHLAGRTWRGNEVLFVSPARCYRDAAHNREADHLSAAFFCMDTGRIRAGLITGLKGGRDFKEVWRYSTSWPTTSQLPRWSIGRSAPLCFCHLFTQACVIDPSKSFRKTSRSGDYHPCQLAHMCLWVYI